LAILEYIAKDKQSSLFCLAIRAKVYGIESKGSFPLAVINTTFFTIILNQSGSVILYGVSTLA
jgi:hypothetical protein